jgi:hypothetical protein
MVEEDGLKLVLGDIGGDICRRIDGTGIWLVERLRVLVVVEGWVRRVCDGVGGRPDAWLLHVRDGCGRGGGGGGRLFCGPG